MKVCKIYVRETYTTGINQWGKQNNPFCSKAPRRCKGFEVATCMLCSYHHPGLMQGSGAVSVAHGTSTSAQEQQQRDQRRSKCHYGCKHFKTRCSAAQRFLRLWQLFRFPLTISHNCSNGVDVWVGYRPISGIFYCPLFLVGGHHLLGRELLGPKCNGCVLRVYGRCPAG